MKAQYTFDVTPIIREWLADVQRAAKQRKAAGGLIEACVLADHIDASCETLQTVVGDYFKRYGIPALGISDEDESN